MTVSPQASAKTFQRTAALRETIAFWADSVRFTLIWAPEQTLHHFSLLFVLRTKHSIISCCLAPLSPNTGLKTKKKKKLS